MQYLLRDYITAPVSLIIDKLLDVSVVKPNAHKRTGWTKDKSLKKELSEKSRNCFSFRKQPNKQRGIDNFLASSVKCRCDRCAECALKPVCLWPCHCNSLHRRGTSRKAGGIASPSRKELPLSICLCFSVPVPLHGFVQLWIIDQGWLIIQSELWIPYLSSYSTKQV